MNLLNIFENSNDEDIRKFFLHKNVIISYKNGEVLGGLITNFIGASIKDDPTRTIVGFVFHNGNEIVISSEYIKELLIIN